MNHYDPVYSTVAIKEIFDNMILNLPVLQLIESGTLYAKGEMSLEQMELCHDILQSYQKELEKDTKKEKPVSSLIEKLHEIQTTENYIVASTFQ